MRAMESREVIPATLVSCACLLHSSGHIGMSSSGCNLSRCTSQYPGHCSPVCSTQNVVAVSWNEAAWNNPRIRVCLEVSVRRKAYDRDRK